VGKMKGAKVEKDIGKRTGKGSATPGKNTGSWKIIKARMTGRIYKKRGGLGGGGLGPIKGKETLSLYLTRERTAHRGGGGARLLERK